MGQALEHVREEAGSTLKALEPLANWLAYQEEALEEALGEDSAPAAGVSCPRAGKGKAGQAAIVRPGQASPLIEDVYGHIANLAAVARPPRPGNGAASLSARTSSSQGSHSRCM